MSDLANRLYFAAGSERLKDDWRTQNLLREAARALNAAPCDSDQSGEAGETVGLDPKDASAGPKGIAQPLSSEPSS